MVGVTSSSHGLTQGALMAAQGKNQTNNNAADIEVAKKTMNL